MISLSSSQHSTSEFHSSGP